MPARTTVLFLLGCLLLCSPAWASDLPSALVTNIAVEEGISESTAELLNEVLLTEVQKTGLFHMVLGHRDIAELLKLEEKKISIGECVDEACLAEVGGALGAAYLVVCNMGRLGNKFIFNLKLINISETKVAGRASIITESEESKLISALQSAVREGVVVPMAVAKKEMGERREEEKVKRNLAPWIVLGGSGVTAIVAGILGGLAWKDYGELQDMEIPFEPRRWDLEDSVRNKALAADILWGVTVAGVIATVVLVIINGDEETQPSATGGPAMGFKF
jgi:hypothetical protein